MKRKFLLKTLTLCLMILLPVWAGAEDLGALRLSQMKGDIQVQSKGATEWFPATINLPMQAGDRLWAPKDAWAQVETQDGSVVRLDADSSLEILAVEKDSLQMYLSQGQAYLNFKKGMDSMFQLDTPNSSLRIYDSSTLNVALIPNGNTDISVFRGAVFAENRSGEVRVGAGKMLSIDGDVPSLVALGPPSDWEKWNREWDESLVSDEDSTRYLPQELSTYGRDLNRNGRWIETNEYGNVWIPTTHVSAEWAPYREGRWVWIGDDYVWIASEPWGWAPYHYGRWAHISSHGWCWVPPPRNEVYWGPGYVSWVSTENEVAWVPLAPAEIYYGHGYYGPHSVNIVNVNMYTVVQGRHYRNVHVHNAVTVVHRETFLTGRHHEIRHPENPFLHKPISIGRPRIEPGRNTKMPIIREIPKVNLPPANIRSLPGKSEGGERPMVRERNRSIFTPSAAPRPLAPTVRMNPEPGLQPERRVPGPDDRKQILEHSVMPGQFKGRPQIDPDGVKSATPPPASVHGKPPVQKGEGNAPELRERPQIPAEHPVMPGQFRGQPKIDPDGVKSATPPPAHIPGPPPSQNERNKAPELRERPQIPEHSVIPGQFRGRPNIDPDAVKAAPPAPKPQIAPPPPAPAPVMHERPQIPERPVMPNQFRGRPNIDPDGVKTAPPPPPKPQIAPPPVQQRPQQIAPPPVQRPQQIAPPPVQRKQQIAPPPQAAPPQGQPGHLDPEALKRLKKQQQEAEKKD
ncbi:MAG: FecR family protein [Desulfocapsaceae bacterium]|nr:FecR family protein [Desulfocapsaceae bacterium]